MKAEILGLEITSQQIRYIFLGKKAERVYISGWGSFSSEGDPSLTKDPTALAGIITEIMHKEEISPARLCLTISGSNVFIHLFDLPQMREVELKEAIIVQIEKIPALSEKDFDFVYSVSKSGEKRMRVLFGAISKENLDFYIQAANQTKLYLESLELSPLNLWQRLGFEPESETAKALLILDETYSQIIIFFQNECELFYTLPTGRRDIYPQAEKAKTLLSISWIDEIKRVFSSYMREAGGRQIKDITLIYDNQKAPGLKEMLNKELNLPVNPPRLEELNIDLIDKKKDFNPIYFLPLAAPLGCLKRLKTEFFFDHFLLEVKARQALRKTLPFALIIVFLISTLLGKVAWDFEAKRKRLLPERQSLQQRISELEKRTLELRKERAELVELKDRLLKQAVFISRLNRLAITQILGRIGSCLPTDVRLSDFEFSESGRLQLKGATLKIDSLAEFIRNIEAAGYFTEVKFNSLKESELEKKRIIYFNISTTIRIKDEKG